MANASEQPVQLPYFGTFDYIWVEELENRVSLRGYASRPALAADAEIAVRKQLPARLIENAIETLPRNAEDDRIRLAARAAILDSRTFSEAANASRPAFHIIVRDGAVTLHGSVDNEVLAAFAAEICGQLRGVKSVRNNLKIGH